MMRSEPLAMGFLVLALAVLAVGLALVVAQLAAAGLCLLECGPQINAVGLDVPGWPAGATHLVNVAGWPALAGGWAA
jgi:hypothetical protein